MSEPSINGLPGGATWNLPFAPQLTTYGSIGTVDSRGQGVGNREVSVKRGYIRTNPRMKDGYGREGAVKYLYFLYNPATLSTHYEVQLDAAAAVAATAGGSGQGNPVGLLAQGLDFSLLFDRTYEVMKGSTEGAFRDVRTALALVGVLPSADQSAVSTTSGDWNTGPMIMTPAYFHFGNQSGGLTYHGYLTSMGIDFTHFSKDMIPVRVGMRMSVTFLPTSQQTQDAGTTPQDDATGTIDDKSYNPWNDPELSFGEQLQISGTPLSRLWDGF